MLQVLRKGGFCWIVACLIAGLSITAARADEAAAYRLGTGDLLRVTVFGHADLSGEFEVSIAGEVTLPLVGNISARDLSLGELEDRIIGGLKPDYLKNPQVSVEVLNYRPFYIIGEVKNPGSYPYVGGMRVINAVAIAGGFTYRARENRLLIRRAGSPNEEPEAAGPATIVLPGDVIEVPERFF